MSRFISWRPLQACMEQQQAWQLPPRGCPSFASRQDVLRFASSKRVVYFGEIHSQPEICELQLDLVKAMAARKGHVHVIMEHFSIDMNDTLRAFQSQPPFTFDLLNRAYHGVYGTEGHNLEPYRPLLDFAKENSDAITLHGGFVPRNYARELAGLRDEQERSSFFKQMQALNYLPSNEAEFLRCYNRASGKLVTSQLHYNMFACMVSGQDIYDRSVTFAKSYAKVFQAQVLKDYSMAYYVSQLMRSGSTAWPEEATREQFLLIGGRGHFQHYLGVAHYVKEFVDVDDEEQVMLTCVAHGEAEASMENPLNEDPFGTEILTSPFIRNALLCAMPVGFTKPLGDVLFVFQ